MSAAPTAVPSTDRRRRLWPGADQVVLRALVVLGSTLPLVAADAAGGQAPGWLQVLVVGLGAWLAVRPESQAGLLLVLCAAWVWTRVGETTSPWVLVALTGVLLAHLGALVAAQSPGRARVEARQAVLWSARGAALLAVGAATWAGGVLLADVAPGRAAYGAGLVVLTALAALAVTALTTRRG